jgi:hypothetical protein
VLPKPLQVAPLGVFMHFPKKVYRFRFIARLTGIIRWDNHFDFDGHNIFVRLNEPLTLQSFAGNSHSSSLIKEVNGNKFGDVAVTEMSPDGFELSSVWQDFTNLNDWIGARSRSFFEQFTIRHAGHCTPFHNTALFESFGSMFPDCIFFLGNKLEDRLEKTIHNVSTDRAAFYCR